MADWRALIGRISHDQRRSQGARPASRQGHSRPTTRDPTPTGYSCNNAALVPGDILDPTASAKHSLRALARRWLTLAAEIRTHDDVLDAITHTAAPTLREAFGIGADSAAEMMIVAGDNPTRVRSEAAFAKLCGACPIPASSGVTHRHRLFRGGHRQANAAIYRIVTVRMRWHQPTLDYVGRRTAQGLTKKDIIRCLKRFVAREIYNALIADHRSREALTSAA